MMVDMGKNGKDIFKNKDWGGSHWYANFIIIIINQYQYYYCRFQPIKFHGDGKVRQHGLSDAQNCNL